MCSKKKKKCCPFAIPSFGLFFRPTNCKATHNFYWDSFYLELRKETIITHIEASSSLFVNFTHQIKDTKTNMPKLTHCHPLIKPSFINKQAKEWPTQNKIKQFRQINHPIQKISPQPAEDPILYLGLTESAHLGLQVFMFRIWEYFSNCTWIFLGYVPNVNKCNLLVFFCV